MPHLNSTTLQNLAKILDLTSQSCKQAQVNYDETKLRRALHSACTLVTASLGMIEDEMTSISSASLAFLAQVTCALMSEPNTDFGMSELLEQVNTHLNTEAISIFMLNTSTNRLVIQDAVGPVRECILDLQIHPEQGVVGWVVKNNETLIVPSTNLDPRFFSEVDEQTGFKTQSILCVPIVQAGHVIGAIELLNKIAGNFDDDDVILMQGIARLIADFL